MTGKLKNGIDGKRRQNPKSKVVSMKGFKNIAIQETQHAQLKELLESRLVHQKYGNPNVPSSKVKLHELIAAFLQEGINANKPHESNLRKTGTEN